MLRHMIYVDDEWHTKLTPNRNLGMHIYYMTKLPGEMTWNKSATLLKLGQGYDLHDKADGMTWHKAAALLELGQGYDLHDNSDAIMPYLILYEGHSNSFVIAQPTFGDTVQSFVEWPSQRQYRRSCLWF